MNGYRRGAYNNPAKGMAAAEVASGAMEGVTSTDWLGQNFGVRFRYNALGDFTKTDTVKYDQSFGITAGVNDVEMHAGSTMVVLDPTRVKGLVYIPKTTLGWNNAVEKSDPANFPNGGVYKGGGVDEGPFAAIAKLEKGKAAFIGDSSPVEDVTPRYVREDNGSKKTTYDGFKSEGQNSVFLVQTVEWLALQEDYATFENKGIKLDSPTPLLANGLENPANSVEIPGTEPWGAPAAGYKWYDPATYKAGAYGTGKGAPEVPIPDLTTIVAARQVSDNTYVTVQGIVTSEPGIFGGSGFYMQDGTAGIYVYPTQATGFHVGDKVKITAQKTIFNTEVELMNDAKVEKLDANANIPAAVPAIQTTLNDSNQGTLVTFKDVTVQNYATVTNSLEFDLVKDGVTSRVRVDSRTNINADSFKQSFPAGTKVDIIGISSIFKGTYQLKLLKLADVQVASQGNQAPVFTAIDAKSVTEGQRLTFQIEATDADGDALTYTAPSLPGDAAFDAISREFSWTPQTAGDYTATFRVTDGKGGEATINVSIKVTPAGPASPNAAILTGPASSYAGSAVDLAVGVKNITYGFTTGSIVVQYDPNVLDFATKANTDGTLSLAETAVASTWEGTGILATGVKPDKGQILVIVGSTGTDHAVNGTGPLLTLHGTLKSSAPAGTTTVALTGFDVSTDGASSVLDITQASWHIEVKTADRTALVTAIQQAQNLYDNAVVGSAPGQYPAAAKAALQHAITAASVVRDNTSATQEELNAALAALDAAVNTFRNAVNPSAPVDKTSLTTAIANAQSQLNKAVTGNKVGQYPAAAKAALQSAITTATDVKNSSSASQSQVDAAVSTLNTALVTFQSKLITLVPGATKITINDLSILAKYFGMTSADPNWSNIAHADMFDEGEISIRSLAAVAQLIVGDWFKEN
jgi:DNA/RNA endonuclease YhcR with UshA esterase domain